MTFSREPRPIDCEQCRHFAGSSFWMRFACAKGHTDKDAEHLPILRRSACADFQKATRAELIFMRSRARSVFYGGDSMKKDAATVKRTATMLRKLSAEESLGRYLDSKEIEHFKAVIALLEGLAPDLTRAAKLGDKLREAEAAASQARHEARGLAVCDEAYPGAGLEELAHVVEDMIEFSRTWRGAPQRDSDRHLPAIYVGEWDDVGRALKSARSVPNAHNLRQLRVEIGTLVEQLRDHDPRVPSMQARRGAGGWTDFVEFRRFAQMKRQIVAGASPEDEADGESA